MTLVEVLAYISIAAIPLGCLAVCFIVALGKRKGFRRRRDVGPEDGLERRCENRSTCNETFSRNLPPVLCPKKGGQPVVMIVQRDADKLE